jgi:hypothetical protein
VPDARLIYLVRDPIDRIVSHYIDAYSFGRTHKPIDLELKDFETHHLVNCSRYYMQLEQYFEYFDPDRFLVVVTEDLRRDPQATMRTIFAFLGVDPSFSSPEFERVLYKAEERRRKTRLGYALVGAAERVRRSRLRPYLSPMLMRPIKAFNAWTERKISRPELGDSLRAQLADFLRPDVDRLRAFTGKDFADWSV